MKTYWLVCHSPYYIKLLAGCHASWLIWKPVGDAMPRVLLIVIQHGRMVAAISIHSMGWLIFSALGDTDPQNTPFVSLYGFQCYSPWLPLCNRLLQLFSRVTTRLVCSLTAVLSLNWSYFLLFPVVILTAIGYDYRMSHVSIRLFVPNKFQPRQSLHFQTR